MRLIHMAMWTATATRSTFFDTMHIDQYYNVHFFPRSLVHGKGSASIHRYLCRSWMSPKGLFRCLRRVQLTICDIAWYFLAHIKGIYEQASRAMSKRAHGTKGTESLAKPVRAHTVLYTFHPDGTKGMESLAEPVRAHTVLYTFHPDGTKGTESLAKPVRAHTVLYTFHPHRTKGTESLAEPVRAHTVLYTFHPHGTKGTESLAEPVRAHTVLYTFHPDGTKGTESLAKPVRAHTVLYTFHPDGTKGTESLAEPVRAHTVLYTFHPHGTKGTESLAEPVRAHTVLYTFHPDGTKGTESLAEPVRAHTVLYTFHPGFESFIACVHGSKKSRLQCWPSGIHCMQAKKHTNEGSALALKPRTHVTRSPKQGYQRPYKRDWCPAKNFQCPESLISFSKSELNSFIRKIEQLPCQQRFYCFRLKGIIRD